MGGSANRHSGGAVEKRIRLPADLAVRLEVAAAVRRMSESELVAWALLPHLAFALPEVPDVAMVPGDGPGPAVARFLGRDAGRAPRAGKG